MSGKGSPDKQPQKAAEGLEIERKFLLRKLPVLPAGADVLRMEQGYFGPHEHSQSRGDEISDGRLRRTTFANGSIKYTHTVKSGDGLIRQEAEQEITPHQFERAWPRTAGRRLRKTRHRVRDGDLVWEIDVFDGIDLVLAEVELPSAHAEVVVPGWLKTHIVREVTDDPTYTNANIALRKLNPHKT